MKVKELKKKEIPSLYCSPLVPFETEAEAVSWAEGKGVDVLYVYERTNGTLYFVEAKDEMGSQP